MANFLRLDGGVMSINMDLVTGTDPLNSEGREGVAVYVQGGKTVFYYGKQAARVKAWLGQHGDLPLIAPEPNP